MCVTAASQLRETDKEGRLEWLDINDPAVRSRFPRIDWKRAEEEIHLVHLDGRVRTGAKAVRDIAELIGGELGQAAAKAMDLPGIRDAADLIYHLVAQNRHLLFGRVEPGADPASKKE
jgi:predicted DCC family thiol-disulfide oxidoreductase YuxK